MDSSMFRPCCNLEVIRTSVGWVIVSMVNNIFGRKLSSRHPCRSNSVIKVPTNSRYEDTTPLPLGISKPRSLSLGNLQLELIRGWVRLPSFRLSMSNITLVLFRLLHLGNNVPALSSRDTESNKPKPHRFSCNPDDSSYLFDGLSRILVFKPVPIFKKLMHYRFITYDLVCCQN